jgi:membrane fusion protein, multidrug efflux system
MKFSQHILATVIIAGALASCSGEASQVEPANNAKAAQEQVRVVNVESMIIEAEPFQDFLSVIGTVKASEDINLAAEGSGRIVEMKVRRGSRVAKGAPIAKIDDEQIVLELSRARAQYENARENYERRKVIWEKDKIGSELDLIAAKTTYEQTQATLKLLELQLDRTVIRAPFNAVVEEIISELGETVAPGTPVVRLISDGSVRVRAGVPARHAESVRVGDSVEISFDEYRNEVIKSTVTFVGGSIDPQARTFNIEANIPNQGSKFKIDMVSNVKIRTRSFEEVIVLAQEFVFRNEDGYQVYLVSADENGNPIAESQQVTTGAMFNNRVVITSGLKAGDEVITTGASSVENMTRIRVANSGTNGVAAVAQ